MEDRIATYRIYGVTLASDSDFGLPLPEAAGPAQLRFSIQDRAPASAEVDQQWARRSVSATDGEIDFAFYALEGVDVIRVPGAADYYVTADEIVCHLIDPRHAALVPVHLFGMVMSLWLERRDVLTLHGAAVVSPHGAIAVLASKGGGKTSMGAALVAAGCELLTDDLLALSSDAARLWAQPAYPQMRMSAEQAHQLVGGDSFPVVNPTTGKLGVPVGGGGLGAFSTSAAPLRVVYLPQRSVDADGIVFGPLSPREALLESVRHTFLPREMAGLGLHAGRFSRLGHLASRVPFVTVRFPAGLDVLPDVAESLVDDVAQRG